MLGKTSGPSFIILLIIFLNTTNGVMPLLKLAAIIVGPIIPIKRVPHTWWTSVPVFLVERRLTLRNLALRDNMSDLKICANCVHLFVGHELEGYPAYCLKTAGRDLVTGRWKYKHCGDVRLNNALCGVNAQWFEQTPSQPPAKSFFKRIFG